MCPDSDRPDAPARSMDDLDREGFRAGPGPLDGEPEAVALLPGAAAHLPGPPVLSLDGTWEMAEGGDEAHRLAEGEWPDALAAEVPGSVHGALVRAGRLPDPVVGKNDALARAESFKTWWLRRRFERPAGAADEHLVFGGIAVSATVWLNGHRLGRHEGMFGGPEYAVAGDLRDHNSLVVRIDPAPYEEGVATPNDFFKGMNVGWMRTAVFNNVYGWHYSNIPALGIWRPVGLAGAPTVRLASPFAAARDARAGVVDLHVPLEAHRQTWSGRIVGTIEPETFEGPAWHFEHRVASATGTRHVHLRMTVPEPRLWWPNGLGAPDLYRVRVSFLPDGEGVADHAEFPLGIRTVEMAPLPGGPRPDRYNWTFVVNGRPVFVKGNGWCTMDPLMDFSRERYDRFLSLARDQHVQMVRAWGSGMPEADAFYDLADRYGIMVLQEWPTAWNSHEWQPYPVLEETVRLNTLRLRPHPSLVMYGGGNESGCPFGPAIDMMGRAAIQLDGTRPFHRGEPWGGSIHDYTCYWGRKPLDFNVTLEASFFGEFGIASMPGLESVLRYLPESERIWPAPEDGSFAHHTPVFNQMEDLSRLRQYAAYFVPEDAALADFIFGSQMAQATGVRHTLERARTRWPDCSGALYYKMNDNYPAASWSCVDWYGVPKLLHYVAQDAFAPLHACVVPSTLNCAGAAVSLPVFLLDDAEALRDVAWEVTVRAYNGALGEIARQVWNGRGVAGPVHRLGELALTAAQASAAPLLVVSEVRTDGALADRGFCWFNYEAIKGSLLRLPRTRVSLRVAGNEATVTNEGAVAAVGAGVVAPGRLHAFRVSDGCFWLDPGESKTVTVNDPDGLRVEGWNVDAG